MGRTPRPEPKGITLADLMVVVAGVAIGYALGPISAKPGILIDFYVSGTFIQYDPYIPHTRPGFIAAFAIALAIVVRRARHGGRPRLGDWPALVAAGHLLGMVVLFRAYAIAFPDGNLSEEDVIMPPQYPAWRPDRWPWGVAWSLAALLLVGSLATLRRRIPGWLAAVGITTVATVLLCGPIYVFAESYDPEATMGLICGPAPIDAWWHYFRTDGYWHLFLWPEWLLYALTTLAAVADLRRCGPRSRAWTDWASLAVIVVVAALWWLASLFSPNPMNVMTLAHVMVRGLLLLGVASMGLLILKIYRLFRERWWPASGKTAMA